MSKKIKDIIALLGQYDGEANLFVQVDIQVSAVEAKEVIVDKKNNRVILDLK